MDRFPLRPQQFTERSIEAFHLLDVSLDRKNAEEIGVPYGSRTRVAAVKGRCPRPLDERDAHGEVLEDYRKLLKLTYAFPQCQTPSLFAT
jgi:hypothetical protein